MARDPEPQPEPQPDYAEQLRQNEEAQQRLLEMLRNHQAEQN